MRKIIMSLVGLTMMMVGLADAESLHLKSGQVVQGKIIEQTDDYIKIENNLTGIPITYYLDEIERIEGHDVNEHKEQKRIVRQEIDGQNSVSIPVEQQVLNIVEDKLKDPNLPPEKNVLMLYSKNRILGQNDEAKRLMQQAIVDYPDNPVIHSQYISFLMDDDRFEEAYQYSLKAYKKFRRHALIGVYKSGLEYYRKNMTQGQKDHIKFKIREDLKAQAGQTLRDVISDDLDASDRPSRSISE